MAKMEWTTKLANARCSVYMVSLCIFILACMVHNCIVPGCSSRSNKRECKGIKFYRLPTAKKTLEMWLLHIDHKISEVSLHIRICSKHLSIVRWYLKYFHGKNIPLPWLLHTLPQPHFQTKQIYYPLSAIINHDHCYCMPHAEQSQLQSTHLTPLIKSSANVHVSSSPIADVVTQASISPFCIEDIADNNVAIYFYTSFDNYHSLIAHFEFLGKSVYHPNIGRASP